MDQDIHQLLRKNLELTEENNRLLRKMRRGAILGWVGKLIWLAALIGVPVYLYITFLAPIMEQFLGAAQTAQDVGIKVQGLQDQFKNGDVEGILNFFKKGE